MTPTQSQTFNDHYTQAVGRLRGSLTALLSTLDVENGSARALARDLAINKNLAWKISRIVAATELTDAAEHLPGEAGLDIFLKAVSRAGATDSTIEEVRNAVNEFNRMVEIHVGDRSTLELLLSNTDGHGASRERHEQLRKTAYQANGGIFGVLAKAQLGLTIMSPNEEDDGMIDFAQIGGLIDFRRLRTNAKWVLFQQTFYNDDGTPRPVTQEPVFPDPERPDSWVMRDYCSQASADLQLVETPRGRQYELTTGSVGNTGAATYVYGRQGKRFASIFRDDLNRRGEIHLNACTPVESAQIDLFVHEAFAEGFQPHLDVYSRLNDTPYHDCPARQNRKLPLQYPVNSLGRGLHAIATPLFDRYVDMTGRVFEQLGCDPERYRGFRVTVPYPPIPTMLMLAFDLHERPDNGESIA